ncbi:CHRD domain-containing protein [Undibacterium sp. Ji50W]|uniref:CHRD domain-containing protein n=1 Tax=Undibacterium sp. Ji50W TaxID=3413041 RepID=UPI003BF22593
MIRKLFKQSQCATVLVLSGVLSACGGNNVVVPVNKVATLSATQEVSDVGSLAKGTGIISVNTETGQISGSITVVDMVATAAHIHLGAAGENGAVIVPMTQDAVIPAKWNIPTGATLTQDQIASFKAGNLYFNAHSVKFPAGEIRGQIGREVVLAHLSGSQENPQNSAAGTGLGVISLDPVTKTADITLTYANIVPTAAHVHTGALTVSGPVTFQIGTPAANKYAVSGVAFTDAQISDFRNKAMYFNIHTTDLPAGEIRGQIGYQVRIASMNGAQENPPITRPSSGVGFAAYDPDTKTVFGMLTVAGFTPTNAHIHRGAAGTNGAVLIPFTVSTTSALNWASSGLVPLADADAILLFEQGLYMNAHSALSPAGEIRGQLVPNK